MATVTTQFTAAQLAAPVQPCLGAGLTGAARKAVCNRKGGNLCLACQHANAVQAHGKGNAANPPGNTTHPIAGTALAQQLSTNGANALAALYPPMPPMPPNPAAQASSVPPSAVTVQPATQAAVVQAVGAWATLGSAPVPNAAQCAAITVAPTAQGGKWVGRLLAYLQQCCPNTWCPGSGIYKACGGASAANPLAYTRTLASAVPNTTCRSLANGNSLPAGLYVQYIGAAPYYAAGGTTPPNGPNGAAALAPVAAVNVGSRPRGGNVATAAQPATPAATVQAVALATLPTQQQMVQLGQLYPQQLAQLVPWAYANVPALAMLLALPAALHTHLAANAAQLQQLVANSSVLLAVLYGLHNQLQTVGGSATVANLQQLVAANTPA